MGRAEVVVVTGASAGVGRAAARAIVWAARHRRREVHLGLMSAGVIWANKFFPGLLDWYLDRTAFDQQQTAEPDDPRRPDNLFFPVPGDHGARGRFGDRARRRSLQFWLSTHRGLILPGLLLGAWAARRVLRPPSQPPSTQPIKNER